MPGSMAVLDYINYTTPDVLSSTGGAAMTSQKRYAVLSLHNFADMQICFLVATEPRPLSALPSEVPWVFSH
jgi:hypothetical protein